LSAIILNRVIFDSQFQTSNEFPSHLLFHFRLSKMTL
jgi:hypothetical protein